jgi:hypothetical protein
MANASGRRPSIPRKLSDEVLYKCAFRCCVCRIHRARPQLHHIDGDPGNNTAENLAPLCSNCHSAAHTRSTVTQNLTPARIGAFKKRWEAEIAEKATRRMLAGAAAELESRLWAYFDFSRLLELHGRHCASGSGRMALSKLQRAGVVDENGFPIKGRENPRSARSVFETLADNHSHAVRQAFSLVTDELIQTAPPVDLERVWTPRRLRSRVQTGTLAFLSCGMNFKTIRKTGMRENRRIQRRAQQIELLTEINTWNVYSNSALTVHFRGRSRVAALLLIRSIEPSESSQRTLVEVKATTLALGVGFPSDFDRTPTIALISESEEVDLTDDE